MLHKKIIDFIYQPIIWLIGQFSVYILQVLFLFPDKFIALVLFGKLRKILIYFIIVLGSGLAVKVGIMFTSSLFIQLQI